MVAGLVKEFKPTIFFLLKFLGIYVIGSLLYGWFITVYEPQPDPITQWVTDQVARILSLIGWPSVAVHHQGKPTTSILFNAKAIVSVFEGCNGFNVVIIFLSFLFALGPIKRSLYWFSLVGIVVIHICNLMRIILLFFVTLYLPDFLYFTHKYLFTAIIYAVVFVMWVIWVRRHTKVPHEQT